MPNILPIQPLKIISNIFELILNVNRIILNYCHFFHIKIFEEFFLNSFYWKKHEITNYLELHSGTNCKNLLFSKQICIF